MLLLENGNSRFLQIALGFYKAKCKAVDIIKPHIWMYSINPTTTFMKDPWCFENPLNFKQTFLNMDLKIKTLHIPISFV